MTLPTCNYFAGRAISRKGTRSLITDHMLTNKKAPLALLADPAADVRPSDFYCRAKTRNPDAKGPYCSHRAGYRTDHVGTGRCYLHGGKSPKGVACSQFKHGRYANLTNGRIKQLLSDYLADENPLDLTEEVALLRAVVHDLVERWESIYGPDGALLAWHDSYHTGKGAPKPRQLPDFSAIATVIDQVGKMVDRVQKAKQERSMTFGELSTVMKALGQEVSKALTQHDIPAEKEAAIVESIAARWANVPVQPR